MLVFKIAMAVGMIAYLTSLAVAQETDSTTSKADKTCTPESLIGRYNIVDGEKEGAKEPKDRFDGIAVTFTKDTVVVADKEKKEIYSASYKLNSTTNPCDITMTSRVKDSAGEVARGLIQKEGDTVKLIYALPSGEVPTKFQTKEKQLYFVMKKAAE